MEAHLILLVSIVIRVTVSLENIISELSEPDIIITEKPNGIEIVYSDSKVCLILGDEVNEKGLITDGSC